MFKKFLLCLVLTSPATVQAGPISAAVCGTVCGIISIAGCTGGSVVLFPLNPPASAIYASVCGYLATNGAIGGCTAACLALPTP